MLSIETAGLRRSFPSRGKSIDAVRGIDLRIEEGAIFGFLGTNGAGKTTTLRMLATLLAPSGGSARVAGHDLLREPARVRERIGYVGQAGGADRGSTTRENLVLQGRLYGQGKLAAQARAAELIDTLNLTALADRPVASYSGGQRRRLDLALGMIHRPTLLFLDEPTTGLDPQSRAHLWDEVRHLREGGTTIFLTTHYLDEADALCDTVAIMDGGRVVAEGSPDALKRQIAGDIITLGLRDTSGDAARAQEILRTTSIVREIEESGGALRLTVEHGERTLPALLRTLEASGIGIQSIALARPSLDDVFLRQTGRSLRDA